jgi:hypothetical protein
VPWCDMMFGEEAERKSAVRGCLVQVSLEIVGGTMVGGEGSPMVEEGAATTTTTVRR